MSFQDPATGCNSLDSKKIVIFNHIPKCGGSTLSNILSGVFPAHAPVAHPGDTLRAAAQLDAFPQDVVLTSGHFVWGIEEVLQVKRTPLYITMLREPFSLFRSFCTYQVKRYNTTLSFREYLQTSYRHNPLCEFLGGGDGDLAKQRLDKYAAFGILEEYGLSLALFGKRLGFTVRDYETRNVSNSQDAQLDTAIEKEFRKHNAMDLDLYAWAVERFRHETRRIVAVIALTRKDMPCEVKRKHVPYVGQVTRHIAKGRYRQAIDLIERHDIRLDGMTMADLYKQAGDLAGYKRAMLDQWKINRIPSSDLAFGLMPLHPRAPERILGREIARYRRLPRNTGDSLHRRYLAECHRCLGLVRQAQDRPYSEVTAVFESGLEVDREYFPLARTYAYYLVQKGQYRRAVQVLAGKAVHTMSLSRRSEHHGLLGDCHARLGEHGQAQACYAAAYEAQPQAEKLSRYFSSLYGVGELPELGRALWAMVLRQQEDGDRERPAFESEVLVVWYMVLLMGCAAKGEAGLLEQGRQELFHLCILTRPELRFLDDGLLDSFANTLLEAGRRADLLAILTILLRSCSRTCAAGLHILLGKLHLMAGRSGPALDMFKAACELDPGKAQEVLCLARQARESGNLILAGKIQAAMEGGVCACAAVRELGPAVEARALGQAG